MAGFLGTRNHLSRNLTTGGCGRYSMRVTYDDMRLYLSSGDFGDFASFVAHMKEIAIVRVVSLACPNTDVLSH